MTIDRHAGWSIAQRSDRTRAAGRRGRLAFAALALMAPAFMGSAEPANAQVQIKDGIPTNAQQTCIVTPADFKTWFESGSPGRDGMVTPADSLGFPNVAEECPFFTWAQRMFYWLTSPVKAEERVFQSPDFFSVSSPDANDQNRRTMTRNPGGKIKIDVRVAKEVEDSPGQAGRRGVLMAQNGSLVYYASYVNDAFAYFRTGVESHIIDPRPFRFPVMAAEIDAVDGVARRDPDLNRRRPLSNRKALVLELKSAWIEAKQGMDLSRYITMKADVPEYRIIDDKTWMATGQSRPDVDLVLVGFHVVGSVNNHPLMIWATFEHIDNSPVAAYTYKNTQDVETPNPSDDRTKWLFSSSNCVGKVNEELMHAKQPPYIKAYEDKIKPNHTCRMSAWGSVPNSLTKKEVLIRNTDIISINNSIRGMMQDGDKRKNYFLVGATWDAAHGGSAKLANTALETFDQDKGCADCHGGSLGGGKLSRLYGLLKPLFSLSR